MFADSALYVVNYASDRWVFVKSVGAEENEKKSSPAVATELCFGFGHTRGRVLEIGFFSFQG